MGCGASSHKDAGARRRRPGSVGDVVVFLPGLRVPRAVDFAQALGGCLARAIVERLSALRSRVVEMAMQESAAALKPRRKAAARHGVCRPLEEGGVVQRLDGLVYLALSAS
jgi:hypothetical protein